MIFLHTFGAPRIDVGELRITPVHPKRFSILLRLCADPGVRVSIAELDEQISSEHASNRMNHPLRQLLYRLRVAGIPIDSSHGGIQLPPAAARTDYGDIIARERMTADDLSAITGGFLPGVMPVGMESFGQWLAAYRARTTSALCHALMKQVAIFRSLGDWLMAEQASRACLALDPLHEEATLALAKILALSGAKAKAVSLLDDYVHNVGGSAPGLFLPVEVLKRRISDRLPAQPGPVRAMPFVGRDREMLLLRDRFVAMLEGRSQCVVISGEPGIGKTRLASEFSNALALEGAHVQRVVVQPHDVHRPMAALAELVPGLLEQPGALGCAPESLQALRRLTGRSEQPLEYRSEDAHASEALYFAITRAVADLVDSVSAERPLVLFIEDVHWLDEASIRMLGQIAAARTPRRVMVLFTTREREAIKKLPPHGDSIAEIELARLDAPAMDRLIAADDAVATIDGDAEIQAWLRTASGGNPLFLQSLMAHFAETGERFKVSPTLRSVLQQRIARLSLDAVLTLQMCVLFGKHSTLDRIESAVHLPRVRLLSAMAELERGRLIEANGNELRAAHALIGETAVQRFGAIDGRLAHRYVAEVLETLTSTDGNPSVTWDCAEHWIAAEDQSRAVTALRQCASLSLEVGRPRGAAEAFLRASELPIAADLREELARKAVVAADMAAEPALVFRGLRLLPATERASAHTEFEFVELAAAIRLQRDSKRYILQLLQCVNAEEASAIHRVTAATLLLKYADAFGDPGAAESVINTLPANVLAAVNDPARLEFELVRAAVKPDHDEVIRLAPLLLQQLLSEPPNVRARVQTNIGFALWNAGALDEALRLAVETHSRAVEVQSYRSALNTAVLLTNCYGDLCDDDAAGRWLAKAETIASEFAEFREEFSIAATSVEYRLAIGQIEAAEERFSILNADAQFSGSPPKERWGNAFNVAFDFAKGRYSEGAIDSLLYPGSRLGLMGGLRDFEVGVACRGLIETAQILRARDVLSGYLESERTHRSPCSRNLATACRMLAEIGGDPAAQFGRYGPSAVLTL